MIGCEFHNLKKIRTSKYKMSTTMIVFMSTNLGYVYRNNIQWRYGTYNVAQREFYLLPHKVGIFPKFLLFFIQRIM